METTDQNEPSYTTGLGKVYKSSEPVIKDSDEISLKLLILKFIGGYRYLLSKWVIIFVAGIFGGILGLTYAWFSKPVFTASTTFVLESGDNAAGGLGQYAGLASMVGVDLGDGGGIFQGDNIIELYKSRTMIEKALLSEIENHGKKQLLIDRYIQFNELRQDWAKRPELANIQFSQSDRQNFSRSQDSILGTIVKEINKNYLTIGKPDKKLSIIQVIVKAEDEVFAKGFNEQVVKKVNDFYVQTKTKKSQDNVAILQQKTDSVRSVMNGAIYNTAVVADATPNINMTRQVRRLAPMQRSQFTAETNKAILSELLKNLEMSKISLRKETPLIQIVDRPVFPLDKDRIGKARSLVLGGLIGGFLMIVLLLFHKMIKTIMA